MNVIHYNHFQHIAYNLDRFIFSELYALVEMNSKESPNLWTSIFRLVIHKQHSNRIEVEDSRQKMKESIDRNRVTATESTEQQNPTRTRKIFGKHYNGIASMNQHQNHHDERKLTERMMCEIERETLRPVDDQYQLIHSILPEISYDL